MVDLQQRNPVVVEVGALRWIYLEVVEGVVDLHWINQGAVEEAVVPRLTNQEVAEGLVEAVVLHLINQEVAEEGVEVVVLRLTNQEAVEGLVEVVVLHLTN